MKGGRVWPHQNNSRLLEKATHWGCVGKKVERGKGGEWGRDVEDHGRCTKVGCMFLFGSKVVTSEIERITLNRYLAHYFYQLLGDCLGAGSLALRDTVMVTVWLWLRLNSFALSFLSSQMSENPHQLSKHENYQKVKNRFKKTWLENTDETSKSIQYLNVLRRISQSCWDKCQMGHYIMEENLFNGKYLPSI